MTELPDHVRENRRNWDAMADQWVAPGERAWASPDAYWGIWGIPNSDLPLLPAELGGKRAIELGCGTGYVSAWMRHRGASVYAIDNSERQLSTARRLAAEHDVHDIEWVHGSAEDVPQPDGSFDYAFSEYGAAIWCDPYVWIAEAHRLLRPGAELVFLGHHPLMQVCLSRVGDSPVDERMHEPYFGMHAADWRDALEEPGGVEFNLPISEWMRLFRRAGFEVLDFWEIQAPDRAEGEQYWVPADWARKWPSEQAWRLRRL